MWRALAPALLVLAAIAAASCRRSVEPAPGFACPEGMVPVPGGSFAMGDDDGAPGERPAHAVTVASLCLDRTEVTVTAYAACVAAGACTTDHVHSFSLDGERFEPDKRCTYGAPGKGEHPVTCVDWDQAVAYCTKQGKRLPTEEEWEYAARGGFEQRTFAWGDAPPADRACWNGDGNDQGRGERTGTCEVTAYPAGDSRWGARGMTGNAWEWTASQLCGYADKGCTEERVERGGGFQVDVPRLLRAAHRVGSKRGEHSYALGFRCAKTP